MERSFVRVPFFQVQNHLMKMAKKRIYNNQKWLDAILTSAIRFFNTLEERKNRVCYHTAAWIYDGVRKLKRSLQSTQYKPQKVQSRLDHDSGFAMSHLNITKKNRWIIIILPLKAMFKTSK